MGVFNLAHVLLSFTLIWLPLHGHGLVTSTLASAGLPGNSVSSSYHASATMGASETNGKQSTIPSTTSSSADMEPSSVAFSSADVMTITRLTTVTQTSFVPVSTLVTQSGSIIYYSTWLVPIYPVTVLTSIEYITSITKTITETAISTISPWTSTSTIYECICPAPETETVYLLATIGPAMAITSAILVSMDSMSLGPQTTVEAISTTTTTLLLPAVSSTPSVTLSSIFLAPGPVIIPTISVPHFSAI